MSNHVVKVQWALVGRGVVLRSMWDVVPLLERGRLQRVLPDVTPPADATALLVSRDDYESERRAMLAPRPARRHPVAPAAQALRTCRCALSRERTHCIIM
ncbi:MAG: hypothetical protein EPN70_21765 [Paraburkholderia sp.]|nr:MAG: hypothetical protein EPN70_21765 [Paraburkholderia sp.]